MPGQTRLLLAIASGVALCATPAVSASAQEVDPAELAEAQAVVEIIFPSSTRRETFAKLITEFSAQMRSAMPSTKIEDPGLKALVDGYLDRLPVRMMPTVEKHLPGILAATAAAYTREFSLPELKEIRAFAETPAGRHYLEASMSLVGDPAVAAANTAYLTELQTLQATVQQELVTEIVQYLESHPELLEELKKHSQT